MTDDDGKERRGVMRYAVRFTGHPMPAARTALEAEGIVVVISAGAFFTSATPGPAFFDHTAVGVLAVNGEEAVRRVEAILVDVGKFSGFEAAPLRQSDGM